MKTKAKKLLALLLSLSMAFSMLVTPAMATELAEIAGNLEQAEAAVTESTENDAAADTSAEESATSEEEESTPEESTTEDTTAPDAEEEPAGNVEADDNAGIMPIDVDEDDDAPVDVAGSSQQTVFTFDVDSIDVDIAVDSGAVATLGEDDLDSAIDYDDPTIAAAADELSSITVLDDDGNSVALTEEQIQTVLYMYQQYQTYWSEHANVLGVQTPFFLKNNDDGEDGLGGLGELLVLAGVTVDDVRSGNYSYDDLTGMIDVFAYGDKLGVEYYEDDIVSQRKSAVQAVEDSGAKTEAQKLLVLNDWMAQNGNFDMAYIMNASDQDNPVMVAEDPVKNSHWDEVWQAIYDDKEASYTTYFHDQFYNGIVENLRVTYYKNAIQQIIYQKALAQYQEAGLDDETAESNAQTDAETYITAHEAEIEADPDAFATENLGEEAAAQLKSGADDFIASAETDGVEVSDGVTMTVEAMTQQQMETTELEDLGGMTANQAIPYIAQQYADGMTDSVIGYWNGCHIGLFGEGIAVCAGYAKAFAYLVEYMHPEYYGVNGSGTDMSVSSNWKAASDLYYDKDGNIDITQDYMVDLVRATFDTSVTMYGEANDDFNADHFWNAVKLDGQWYYIDPCYNDVYTEVMVRDRVETDGSVNHAYFLFSHTTTETMYEGSLGEAGINSLYSEAATDKSYESAWFSRAKSNVYSDGTYFYYIYDSTDLFEQMEMYRKLQNSSGSLDESEFDEFSDMNTDTEYKLVRHKITSSDDTDGADTDFEILIDFNYVPEDAEDDTASVARVRNSSGELVENELLTELFAQYEDECDIYPSIAITSALYNNKLYFNLSNCILSYDLSSCEVTLVKEYNTVYATHDKTVTFAGMSFSVTDDASKADLTVENHPIAGMTIKDGKMYVDIATNYAYISGKDPHNSEDQSSYGYEFEESNYNPDYSSYFSNLGDSFGSQMEEYGYEEEINDNDEFMWSAVLVETTSMSDLTGSHSYEAVTIAPFCGRDGYTENRCTKCGAIEDGTREYDEGSALDHHYIHFDEEYYTKDDNDNWNTGESLVCTICGYAVEPGDGEDDDDWDESKDTYAQAEEKAGHVYTPSSDDSVTWAADADGNVTASVSGNVVCEICDSKKDDLDVLIQDNATTASLSSAVELEVSKTTSGTCDEGVTTVYTATGTSSDGKKLTATKTEVGEAGEHSYTAVWTWSDAESGEQPTATATLTCQNCDKVLENQEATVVVDTENSTDPTCTAEGKTVYTATVTDENSNVLAADSKEVTIAKLDHNYTYTDNGDGTHAAACSVGGETLTEDHTTDENDTCTKCGATFHDYEEVWAWSEDYKTAAVTLTCKNDGDTQTADAAVTQAETAATCDKDGEIVYTATATVKVNGIDKEYTDTQTEVIPALGHDCQNYTDNGDGTHSATCTVCGETLTENHTAKNGVCTNCGAEVLAAPELTGIKNTSSGVKITWNAVEDADGYRVYRKSGDSEWTALADVDGGETVAYSDTEVESGEKYTYTVAAYNGTDESESEVTTQAAGSSAVWSDYDQTGLTIQHLAIPTMKSAKNSSTGVAVKWSKVTGADGYRIYRKANGATSWTKVKTVSGGDTVSWTDTDVSSGSTYVYVVRAYAKSDDTTYWGSYKGTKTTEFLAIPTMKSVTNASSGLTVKWSKVSAADGYAVYRKAGSETSWTKVKTISKNSTVSWTDKDVTNGTKYTYVVKAYTKQDSTTYWGSYKSSKSSYYLKAPKLSSLTKGSKQFKAKWSKNAKATGYEIQYSTSKDFSNAKSVKVTKASAVTKTVKKLSKKKTYYVRVRAYKTVSKTTYYSTWSNSKNVKTK